MKLSNALIKQFVDVTNDSKNKKVSENITYGTIVQNGSELGVLIDGATNPTPITKAMDAKLNDRVIVSIKNHTATITGNLTKPANNLTDEVDVLRKVITDEVNNTTTTFEQLANMFVLKLDANGNIALFKIFEDTDGTNILIKADNISLEGLITANNGFKILLDGSFDAVAGAIAGFTISPEDQITHEGGMMYKDIATGKMIRLSPFCTWDGNGGFDVTYGSIDLGVTADGQDSLIHLRDDGYARFGLKEASGVASIRINDYLRYEASGGLLGTNTLFYSPNFKINRDGTVEGGGGGEVEPITALGISDTSFTVTTAKGSTIYGLTKDASGKITAITQGGGIIPITWS